MISIGHAFIQNLRRGHYELTLDLDANHRIPAAFTELVLATLKSAQAAGDCAIPRANATGPSAVTVGCTALDDAATDC